MNPIRLAKAFYPILDRQETSRPDVFPISYQDYIDQFDPARKQVRSVQIDR